MAKYTTGRLRKTDLFARLGGDEFVFLLVETGPELARAIISKFQQDASLRVPEDNSPVSFSMGVVTCVDASLALEDILEMVDDLMYSIKRDGKAGIKYSVYGG